MRLLADPKVYEIKRLLEELKENHPHTVAYTERIFAIILQGEPITLRLESC